MKYIKVLLVIILMLIGILASFVLAGLAMIHFDAPDLAEPLALWIIIAILGVLAIGVSKIECILHS